MWESLSYQFHDEMEDILGHDDKESFVKLCHKYAHVVEEEEVDLVACCISRKAKNCLIAVVSGEVCEPPPALPGCATCIHHVVVGFPDLDVVNMMLARGAINDLNTNYKFSSYLAGTPLYLVLRCFSDTDKLRMHSMHLGSWSPGDSIFKLIVLLCTWEMKNLLDIVRKFACYTDSVNDIAWCFLENGQLLQLTALLLTAHKKVMAPFETGMTIQQCLTNKIDELSSKVHFDNEHAEYKSLLMDASKLFDIFERTGDDFSTYCTSINKYVTPEKVVVDVMGLFRKAGIELQAVDVDLRDCYRGHLGVWKSNLFNLSDCDDKFPLHSYPTVSSGLGDALNNFPYCHWDPLIGKLKSRGVVKLAATPRPRLMSTVSGPSSSIPAKHLAYVAVKLKRGIRY